MTKKKPRETGLWQFDPSIFQPEPKAGFVERHILDRARSLGKYTLYSLAFAYPIVLVSIGVMFGGLVFWTSFASSAGLLWLIIKKTGYSKNFDSHDVGYKRFIGLIGAFGIALALINGLIYIKLWVVPIFAAALVLVLLIGLRRASS